MKNEPKMSISPAGTKHWRLKNGKFHREDGPAIERPDGTKEWWINGERHREDGPAIIDAYGRKEWYFHNKLHRENGAAWIWDNGTIEWYLHGELHRTDGPAVEFPSGTKEWWLNDICYTFNVYIEKAGWSTEQIVEWKLTHETP